MELILIRHSRTQPTHTVPVRQWGLTEEGIQLAKDLSKQKIISSLDVLYSSLQTKAIETSLYLAKPHGVPMKTHPGLDEISSFTRTFLGKDFEKVSEDFYRERIARIAEGETWREALRRFKTSLESIVAVEKKRRIRTVGIVSHGNILAFFTAHYTQTDPYMYHKKIQMPDVAMFDWETKEFEVGWGEVK
ncbi:histidine phosphatase family protein [candidate division WWE3 bacterium]|uniref:Histidine phosphatase family protein n=1 Tax=candidate division WWE3 bacterium TaxID=2053526 RepID=A0A955LV42_UNCKA|nr:histidine phosphatase family protein [candidate division WWE3 bacterium]